jgi:DNA mismatch repair protein MutS
VRNVHLDAVEHRDHVVFMHRIQEGAASRSFGLQVAKLAGVPAAVLNLAARKLRELEAAAPTEVAPDVTQGDLFGGSEHPVVQRLAELDPDDLSPRQASALLYELRALVD